MLTGSHSFANNNATAAVLRDTKTFSYDYGANEYGDSPGNRSFSATLSGVGNGVTPKVVLSNRIPARPYAAPADPTAATAARIDDFTTQLTWARHATAGEPWDQVEIQRWNYATSVWIAVSTVAGNTSTVSDTGLFYNGKYKWRVRAKNSVGNSGWDETGDLWTTPYAPTSCTRTTSGANQLVSWGNQPDYPEYQTEVWHAANGVWDASPLASVANGVTSYTHVAPSGSVRHMYRVRHKNTSGATLYSSYSGTTTETAPPTSAPNAPSMLSPDGGTLFLPSDSPILTWRHNSTDTTGQRQFAVRHRELGSGTWTTTATQVSTVSSYTLAANSYPGGKSIEWQVMTWGTNATGSAWSASAIFGTVSTAPGANRYPVVLNPLTGQLEANSGGLGASTAYLQVFTFASAAATWTMTHNQGRKSLSYYAETTNGHQLVGELDYPDTNTMTLTFYYPETGTVTIYG